MSLYVSIQITCVADIREYYIAHMCGGGGDVQIGLYVNWNMWLGVEHWGEIRGWEAMGSGGYKGWGC